MKITLVWLAVLAAFLVAQTVSAASPAKPVRKGRLVHAVSFKFKPDASQADIDRVIEAFSALPGKIKAIGSYEWGTNVSPEKHDKGFTHFFLLTFKSDKDRDAYLVHPDHQAFGKIVGPVLADVFVIDYWARK